MCNKEELDETVRNYPDLHDKGNNDLKKAPDARKSNVVALFQVFLFLFCFCLFLRRRRFLLTITRVPVRGVLMFIAAVFIAFVRGY